MTRVVRLTLAVALGLWLWSAPCSATTVVAKSFTDLCAEADMIFAATVSAVQYQGVGPDHAHIETRVTFTDMEPVFGVAADSITLRFSGGVLDGVREEFLGVPRFAVGDRVVLFAHHGREISPIVGMSQGYFRVIETASGQAMADADGHAIAGVDRLVARDGGQAAATTPVSPSQFLSQIRRELDALGRQ